MVLVTKVEVSFIVRLTMVEVSLHRMFWRGGSFIVRSTKLEVLILTSMVVPTHLHHMFGNGSWKRSARPY